MADSLSVGNDIHRLAGRLWPFNRSITGDGVRKTLLVLKEYLPTLELFEIESGTSVFDWTVPREWRVRDAYIITPDGRRICDFRTHNLHLVGYSIPISARMPLSELQHHLHSLPNQPDAIPYITSYYEERWGFCLTHRERLTLQEGEYQVIVDTELFSGSMTYAELLLPGESQEEVFLSTYICHPSMANNELSGPAVTTFLCKKLLELKRRRYSYRIVFVPETIGSICYLSRNLDHLRQSVIAGFNVSCVGDNRNFSYLPSRDGETLSDKVAVHVLRNIWPNFRTYKWIDRGSDERQYCAPGVDLPIASIMRTKYGEYEEYHTSLDDLDNVVTPEGLEGGFNALWRSIECIENNYYPRVNVLCEPQMGRRGLYPTLSTKNSGENVRLMMNLITYADGRKSLLEIADLCDVPVWELYPISTTLSSHGLLTMSDRRISM